MLLLGACLKRLIELADAGLAACALIFASSMSVVMLAHTIGYSDQIGFMVALITLQLHRFRYRYLSALLGGTVAILAHEAAFVVFFPLLFLALAMSAKAEGGS